MQVRGYPVAVNGNDRLHGTGSQELGSDAQYDRLSMHGVRRALVQQQADAIGIAMTEVAVPSRSSNAVYERETGHAFARLQTDGIRRLALKESVAARVQPRAPLLARNATP